MYFPGCPLDLGAKGSQQDGEHSKMKKIIQCAVDFIKRVRKTR
jgi:hypothetical protein